MARSTPPPGLPANLLLVSPHLDDAILSCEALIGGDRVLDVLTVCAGRPEPAQATWWDQRAGFDDSDAVMTARLAEDEAAFAGTPHRRHHLDLLDSQYLGTSRPDADARVLTAWVDAWLTGVADPGVVLPAGAGMRPPRLGPLQERVERGVRRRLRRPELPGPPANPDHVWVRDTLARHLGSTQTPIAFYEEMPYAWGGRGGRPVRRLARALGRSCRGWRTGIDRVDKAGRVAAYVSQVPLLIDRPDPMDTPAGLPAGETYWLCPAPDSTERT